MWSDVPTNYVKHKIQHMKLITFKGNPHRAKAKVKAKKIKEKSESLSLSLRWVHKRLMERRRFRSLWVHP